MTMGIDMARGVFPTMITPFTEEHRIDYDAVDALVEYYARCGCTGIFADCQSSEMFYLSEAEKKQLTRHVVEASNGRMQIVASGHTADDPDEQVRELAVSAEAGAAAAVLVLNRLARRHESEDVAKRNIERILTALPDVTFGVYECPHPYKRLASCDLLRFMADTGRIVFLKDTCCDIKTIEGRVRAVSGTPLCIYNANTATLLDSLKLGLAGYSGIMANFHADLYVELFRMHREGDARAELLQSFLTTAALIERQLYPVNAKYHLRYNGIAATMVTRSQDDSLWNSAFAAEVDQLHMLEEYVRAQLGLKR